MAEIVNLQRARKAKARAEKEAKADQNRIRFGRGKAEKSMLRETEKLAARKLEGHRLDGEERE